MTAALVPIAKIWIPLLCMTVVEQGRMSSSLSEVEIFKANQLSNGDSRLELVRKGQSPASGSRGGNLDYVLHLNPKNQTLHHPSARPSTVRVSDPINHYP